MLVEVVLVVLMIIGVVYYFRKVYYFMISERPILMLTSMAGLPLNRDALSGQSDRK